MKIKTNIDKCSYFENWKTPVVGRDSLWVDFIFTTHDKIYFLFLTYPKDDLFYEMQISRNTFYSRIEEGNFLDSNHERYMDVDVNFEPNFKQEDSFFIKQKTWKIWGTSFASKYLNLNKKIDEKFLRNTFFYYITCANEFFRFFSEEEPKWKVYPKNTRKEDIIMGYLNEDVKMRKEKELK